VAAVQVLRVLVFPEVHKELPAELAFVHLYLEALSFTLVVAQVLFTTI
jgi:hypothetical protein